MDITETKIDTTETYAEVDLLEYLEENYKNNRIYLKADKQQLIQIIGLIDSHNATKRRKVSEDKKRNRKSKCKWEIETRYIDNIDMLNSYLKYIVKTDIRIEEYMPVVKRYGMKVPVKKAWHLIKVQENTEIKDIDSLD